MKQIFNMEDELLVERALLCYEKHQLKKSERAHYLDLLRRMLITRNRSHDYHRANREHFL